MKIKDHTHLLIIPQAKHYETTQYPMLVARDTKAIEWAQVIVNSVGAKGKLFRVNPTVFLANVHPKRG
jgi:hypothetical protein